jgi:ribonuclease T1
VRLISGLLFLVASSAFAFSPGEIRSAQLPPEARETIALIRKGGPFPYERDGATFGNREGILPARERGWYREYTVRTPGERTRGARRIVAGRDGTLYYTDDHYRSFRRILE